MYQKSKIFHQTTESVLSINSKMIFCLWVVSQGATGGICQNFRKTGFKVFFTISYNQKTGSPKYLLLTPNLPFLSPIPMFINKIIRVTGSNITKTFLTCLTKYFCYFIVFKSFNTKDAESPTFYRF